MLLACPSSSNFRSGVCSSVSNQASQTSSMFLIESTWVSGKKRTRSTCWQSALTRWLLTAKRASEFSPMKYLTQSTQSFSIWIMLAFRFAKRFYWPCRLACSDFLVWWMALKFWIGRTKTFWAAQLLLNWLERTLSAKWQSRFKMHCRLTFIWSLGSCKTSVKSRT